MTKISLKKFIDDNEKLIFVLGIFLALLPLSFDTINSLNPDYAAYVAIAISVAVLLILNHFLFEEKANLSFEALIFVMCLGTIASVVAILTFKVYTNITLSFINFVLDFFYIIMGAALIIKLITNIDMRIAKNENYRLIFNFLMFLLFLTILKFNFDVWLNQVLLKLNITLLPILTVNHQMLFFGGIYFIILIYGAFVSGIGYFGKKIFYEQIFLKLFNFIIPWKKLKILLFKKKK